VVNLLNLLNLSSHQKKAITKRPTRLLSIAMIGLLTATTPAAIAGQFSVSPVRIFMDAKERAIAITVTNEGDEQVVMQADVYSWKQKPGGEDDLVLSEDLILSPPIIKIPAKSKQVLRLARIRVTPAADQLTYRMIVREIPEARPNTAQNLQLQIALAFSLPVFITPPTAKRQLACAVERATGDTVKAVCENTGNAYAQLREITLTGAAGDKITAGNLSGYVLPGIRRGFDVKRNEGRIAGGKAKLAVSTDDGTTQTFDVVVPD
jgi:fimbrial chaperone protein